MVVQALIKGLNADNNRLVTELQREKLTVASLERKTAAVCVQMEKQLAEVCYHYHHIIMIMIIII